MKTSKLEIADTIERFLEKRDRKWDWDDFISIRLSDPELDKIRRICADLIDEVPPTMPGEYCNDTGKVILTELVKELRRGQ